MLNISKCGTKLSGRINSMLIWEKIIRLEEDLAIVIWEDFMKY